METIHLNEKEFTVIRLLGKGKGGYSYLVTDGAGEYVLKQIHHEPCDYYQFGDKLASELRDYERLRAVGIPIPELLEVEPEQVFYNNGVEYHVAKPEGVFVPKAQEEAAVEA